MNVLATNFSNIEIKLSRQVDAELASDIEKQSVYISTDIDHLHVNSNLDGVVICLKPGADTAVVKDKTERFLAGMVSRFRKIEPTVHYRHDRSDPHPITAGVYEELQARGWLFEHGQGQVSLSGPALRLLHAVDQKLGRIYLARFDAQNRSYPAMIRADVLARCGYFEMHPNAVSFVSHVVEDFDELERFRQANAGHSALQVPGNDSFAKPHYCLNPAACFPCYEAYEGRTIPGDGTILTWMGRVFRYESRNIRGLDRLWEFNVRELVFLGTDAFVNDCRKEAVDIIGDIAEEWDLDLHIETANDPFFATVYAAKTFFQQSLDVKSEIRLAIAPDETGKPRSIAGGSINLHGPFFGNRFDIKLEDASPAISACVGFGLERWVLALFSQHGFEPARWPAELRDIVFSKND
jgi:seryl-tRNA synthetase